MNTFVSLSEEKLREELLNHPLVSDCVVVTKEKGNQSIHVAYLVTEETDNSIEELTSLLKSKMSVSVQHTHFIFLKAFPKTPDGKINFFMLPDLEEMELSPYTPPRNQLEEDVAQIWKELLEIEQIGIHDSIVELGANSIMAMQFASRVKESFQVELPIRIMFEATTVAQIAEQIKEAMQFETMPLLTPLCRSELEGARPLSFAQKRLWFADQLDPGNPLYNITVTMNIEGNVKRELLEKSWEQIVVRHEALRTRFVVKDVEPVQSVMDLWEIDFNFYDLRQLTTKSKEIEREQIIQNQTLQRFNLEKGPLFAISMIQLDEAQYQLCITTHHIISDGWSMDVIARELVHDYQSLDSGPGSESLELPIQFSDYAIWQHENSYQEMVEKQMEYWIDKLQDKLPVLQLPTDYPRPPMLKHDGEIYRFEIPETLKIKLEEMSRNHGVTLFMTLLAAYQTLLSRYSGEKDLLIGTPFAGRNHSAVEDLVGFFVNTLALRTDLSGEISFSDLLQRVREETIQSFSYPDVPFDQLVEAIQPERNPSYTPIFQVMFAYQQMPTDPWKFSDLTIHRPVEVPTGLSEYDLTLYIDEGEQLYGRWEYRTDLFERVTIERMTDHLIQLLHEVCKSPEQPIEKISIITEAEKKLVLYDWNQTEVPFPREKGLHQLFEEQVLLTPHHTAVIYGDQTLSYDELNRRANQLAHFLREKGVQEDQAVGVCIERSFDLIVALMAILKAGGAYLPLDTESPAARLEQILQDADSSFCLIQDQFQKKFASMNVESIALKQSWETIETYSEQNIDLDVNPEQLVSIYYTSGSTGKPKGVASTHEGWVNRMVWMQRKHQMVERETALHKTTLTFDDSAVEIFWPLMVGARIALIEPGLHRDPRAIIDAGIRYQATLIQFVPSMLRMVLDNMTPEDKEQLSCVRVVISSGEALPAGLVEKFLERMPGTLFNTWGATEVSIDSTVHTCSEEDVQRGGIVSVGRPFDNNMVYVLDDDLQPVPIGVPGDLYLAGIGLAREYINQPDKTKEAFIENPFVPGTRMYRTGDRGYFLKDGSIIFLGRKDNQVKIRGMRVELGEIESTLRRDPGVKEAVVIVQEHGNVKRLVAYIATHVVGGVDIQSLRSFMSEQLPNYMVPSYYMLLDELPLNANGKIDRQALPQPDLSENVLDHTVEPTTEAEKSLATIFSEILGVQRVGIHDDFFVLGGHSLLAVQVVSRIQNTFNVKIPLRSIFESPTVAQLIEVIEKEKATLCDFKQLQKVDRTQTLPVSYSQKRMWFLHQLEPLSTAYHMPFCIHLQGKLDVEALTQGLQQMIDRHEILRTVFQESEGEPAQSILETIHVDLPVIPFFHILKHQRMEQAKAWYLEQMKAPFDLKEGPLVKFTLLQIDEEEFVLVMILHHILADGWSLDIIKRELTQVYQGIVEKQNFSLPPLQIQYADFAYSQRKWMEGEEFQNQLAYWKQQLSGELPRISLPMDEGIGTDQPSRHTLQLSPELSTRLREWSQAEGATLFMTLLAAFKSFLYRITGEEDMIVGTPIIDRSDEQLEPLVGMFLNTLVLRNQVSDEISFKEFVGQVRETTLQAYTNQDVPFEMLVEEIQPTRSLNRNPLFDIFVNYVNFEDIQKPSWSLPQLKAETLDWHDPESKFLLTLYIVDLEDGIELDLVHPTGAFSNERMIHWLDQFKFLLEQLVQSPDQPLNSYSLAGEKSKHLLPDLTESLDRPSLERVWDLIVSQQKQFAYQVALSHRNQTLTYEELIQRVEEMGEHLQLQGVKPREVVAIRGQRSIPLMVSLLSVWKTEAVFLLIDPDLPASRQELLLEESAASWLIDLHTEQIDVGFAEQFSIQRLTSKQIPSDWEHLELDPAYIYFTSGTTGKPKGVLGSHQGLSHFLQWQRSEFAVGPSDRVGQLTNLSFDVFLRDSLIPLISGGTLCIPDHPEDISGEYVIPWLEKEKITLVHTVPSIVQTWLSRSESFESLASLRLLFFAGEPLTGSLVQRWRRQFPQSGKIVNLYGPTETTLAKCFYVVPDRVPQGMLPVGQPIPQTQVYVMDSAERMCGVGETGEIVIRTPFRSLGYLESYASTFAPHPVLDDENDRVYYTGDRGRLRPDGLLEVLGRSDEQVKIRGVRVDLNEITNTLVRHEEVESCVVLACPKEEESFLAAYLVPVTHHSLNTNRLRTYLSEFLPPVMIPTAFMLLEQLPLTPNGKIDRKSLPKPEMLQVTTEMVAPRNQIEERMIQIWSEVLTIESQQIGINSNFFELGGHSLLAMQVLTRIEKEFNKSIPLKQFFEKPTIADLSAAVEQVSKLSRKKPVLRKISREQHIE
ncbi:non-ribosomal peptide synthetase [Hazenella coriacea]|uniref:Amino acid adenylation domain-containing protein n=1 Tax=Hazenella coriacea TaxID=1179467 RepID=A0A4R3L3R1_9BACL|nr:non-ribosomal peptide synthetase [Hazenella coriacea]TCS92394.1 amino acid adenylation domain-containing protein [Hazenella coriacea]